MTVASTSTPSPSVTSRWSLIAAPFTGLIYYLAMLLAFRATIGYLIAERSDITHLGLTWGKHWIYHAFAEAVSVTFGTFVAAGIARERADLGGLIGGFGIVVAILLIHIPGLVVGEPPYQYVIGGIAAITAPLVGYNLGAATRKIGVIQSRGFSGIPSLHFIWLWIPAYYYADRVIGPFLTYLLAYFLGYNDFIVIDSSLRTGIVFFAGCVLPVVTYAIPLFVGLGLLSGRLWNSPYRPKPLRPARRQALGALVLIVGLGVAVCVDEYLITPSVNWFVHQ